MPEARLPLKPDQPWVVNPARQRFVPQQHARRTADRFQIGYDVPAYLSQYW
jgi:hypothetical protein